MICPRCKSEMNDDMNFCPHCGMKIEKCPACHQPIIQGAKFCSHCGSGLNPNHQKSHIGGYYQPLNEIPQQPHFNEPVEPTVAFEDVEVKTHVNKKLVIVLTVLVVVLTAGSYFYLKYGPDLSQLISDSGKTEELPQTKMTINQTTTFSTHTGNINQSGHVYQTSDIIYMIDDNGKIVSMDKNLENRKTIVNEKSEYLNVVDNVIYYTNAKNQLCRISIDGKDQKILVDQAVYYVIVKENKIYYQLDNNKQEHIYVYDLKTNKAMQLNKRNSYNLNIVDNKIYYTSTDGIYSIGIDGKGEEKLLSQQVYNMIYQNNKLYYLTSTNEIASYDVSTRKTETILSQVHMFMNMTDQYIFYLNASGQLTKYDLSTQKSTTIYNGNIKRGYVVGDKLIIETYMNSYKKDSTIDYYKVIVDFDGNEQRLFMESNGNYI